MKRHANLRPYAESWVVSLSQLFHNSATFQSSKCASTDATEIYTTQYFMRQARHARCIIQNMQAISRGLIIAITNIEASCRVHTSLLACTSAEICFGMRACTNGLSGSSNKSVSEKYSIGASWSSSDSVEKATARCTEVSSSSQYWWIERPQQPGLQAHDAECTYLTEGTSLQDWRICHL